MRCRSYFVEEGIRSYRNAAVAAFEPCTSDGQAKQARIDFFDVWSDLFQQAYLIPIRDWCRKYGLLSGGHFGGEDETMGSALYGYGHILRAMRGMDLPGVDTIWRLFPVSGITIFLAMPAASPGRRDAISRSPSLFACTETV